MKPFAFGQEKLLKFWNLFKNKIDLTTSCGEFATVSQFSTTYMRCPKCGTLDDKVIDSRLSKDGATIRRRRECLDCQSRFTTYEVLERNELRVIKRDGRHELFERNKLLGSIGKACEKRSVTLEAIEHVVEDILQEIENSQEREFSSKHLGALVMARLHALDPVAYVRYASVYRQFQEVGDFIEEIESLGRRVALTPDQAELFNK